MASLVSAVCPPTSYRTPRRPAALPSSGSRVVRTRTCPIAVAFSGSVSYTSAKRIASPSLATIGLADDAEAGRADGPTTLATPGCRRSAASRRLAAAVCDPAPDPMTSTSAGASIPGANPAAAAAPARATSDDAGISPISGDPSPSPRAPEAASTSPATHPAATSNATGLEAASRASRNPAAVGLSSAGVPRNIRPPNTPSSAGISVSETTMDTSTVAASPGPNARSRPPRATTSAPVPAATISPAARTIGADLAVESRTACRRPAPSASRERIPARKNTQ